MTDQWTWYAARTSMYSAGPNVIANDCDTVTDCYADHNVHYRMLGPTSSILPGRCLAESIPGLPSVR